MVGQGRVNVAGSRHELSQEWQGVSRVGRRLLSSGIPIFMVAIQLWSCAAKARCRHFVTVYGFQIMGIEGVKQVRLCTSSSLVPAAAGTSAGAVGRHEMRQPLFSYEKNRLNRRWCNYARNQVRNVCRFRDTAAGNDERSRSRKKRWLVGEGD